MPPNEITLGPRLKSVRYDGEITGIDYLTGIEFPLSHLVLVSADKPEFDRDQADYIARFCYKYGVANSKTAPLFVSESSLEVVEKAREQDIPVEITDYKNGN